MEWNTKRRQNQRKDGDHAGIPSLLATTAELIAPEKPVTAGEVAHITPASHPQWCPQPPVSGKQWQCGLRSYPSSCKDPHDSCPLHPIYNSRGHEPYNTWQSRGIHVSPDPTDSPQPMWWWSLQLKGSQSWWKSTLSWRPREWCRQHWQQQGNNDHGGKRSNNEVIEQHLWQRQWEVECQI